MSLLDMRHLRQHTFVLFLALIVCSEAAQDSVEVNTKLGKIIGKKDYLGTREVNAFLAVPYAKPPLGDLRFKKSEPVEPWNEPIRAIKNPPACPQRAPPFPWYDGEPPQNEDCLYMNIFVPATPKKGRTVLFWLYGGGFFVGSIKPPLYNSKALALVGDVIVVTVNYRLGPLGFLYSGSKDAPGNAGISDMILGLKWVKDNIEAFGGDPDSITIFGQSAGSISVSLLTISPQTKGLYNRAILMSGSAFSLPAGNKGDLDMGQKLAERVNCASESVSLQKYPEQVVGCLRRVDADTLIKVTGELNPHSSRTFLPVYGDDLVGENPQESLKSGQFHNTDIMVGNVPDEGSFQLATSHPDMFGFWGQKDTLVNKTYGEMLLKKTFSRVANPDEAAQFYLRGVADNDGAEIRKRVYTASGDFTLLCPTVYHAEEFAKRNNKVYYYVFNHRPSNTPWAPWMGVVHFEDVQFPFGQPYVSPWNYRPEEIGLSDRVMRLWTNFAKTGYPGENWPLYSPDSQNIRIIDTFAPRNEIGPHKENCDFLRKYYGLDDGKKKWFGGRFWPRLF